MKTFDESQEINSEDLQAANQVYEDLLKGVHYKKQTDSGFTIKFLGEKTTTGGVS